MTLKIWIISLFYQIKSIVFTTSSDIVLTTSFNDQTIQRFPTESRNEKHSGLRSIVRLIVSLSVDETTIKRRDTRNLSFPYDWCAIYEFLAAISSHRVVAELLQESDQCPPRVHARAFLYGDRSPPRDSFIFANQPFPFSRKTRIKRT